MLATTLDGIHGSLGRVQAQAASKQGCDDYFGLCGDEAAPQPPTGTGAGGEQSAPLPLPPRHGRELGRKNVRGGAAPYPLGARSSARPYSAR